MQPAHTRPRPCLGAKAQQALLVAGEVAGHARRVHTLDFVYGAAGFARSTHGVAVTTTANTLIVHDVLSRETRVVLGQGVLGVGRAADDAVGIPPNMITSERRGCSTMAGRARWHAERAMASLCRPPLAAGTGL